MQSLHERLMILIQSALSGGIRDHYSIEAKRRIIMGNALTFTDLVILIPMGFISLAQQNTGLFLADLIVAAFLIGNMFYLRISGHYGLMTNVVVGFLAVFYYYLFVSGGIDNTTFVWVNTFPLLACFLLGARRGAYTTFIFFCLSWPLCFFVLNWKAWRLIR